MSYLKCDTFYLEHVFDTSYMKLYKACYRKIVDQYFRVYCYFLAVKQGFYHETSSKIIQNG